MSSSMANNSCRPTGTDHAEPSDKPVHNYSASKTQDNSCSTHTGSTGFRKGTTTAPLPRLDSDDVSNAKRPGLPHARVADYQGELSYSMRRWMDNSEERAESKMTSADWFLLVNMDALAAEIEEVVLLSVQT
ncbi:unnamed protein product [Zymoseptoria tritici ST99CH_3D7]|uniref:Uncharacterized protein n=2 Tax=Zymoseptoria tritici TaxID=1047171 RepID=A0A1X7RP71_ZYMT9|nr:unnamed protein product [Zymoseptoria tritici ST99CH_3D7]SMR49029.1 unnamed protein product [Zymoseptoria tritici ST99CH_1E4]